MKAIFGVLGAGIVATWALTSPANAACAWNGYAWHCWKSERAEVRSDRHEVREEHGEIRHDKQHLRHVESRLSRDIHTGSSRRIVHDVHRLARTQRELRSDHRELHGAQHELREDRAGE